MLQLVGTKLRNIRGKLGVVFSRLRKGQAIDAHERAAFVAELAALIDPS